MSQQYVFFCYFESINFWSKTVHYSRLEIILHHKYSEIDMSLFFLKINKGLASWRVDFLEILSVPFVHESSNQNKKLASATVNYSMQIIFNVFTILFTFQRSKQIVFKKSFNSSFHLRWWHVIIIVNLHFNIFNLLANWNFF